MMLSSPRLPPRVTVAAAVWPASTAAPSVAIRTAWRTVTQLENSEVAVEVFIRALSTVRGGTSATGAKAALPAPAASSTMASLVTSVGPPSP